MLVSARVLCSLLVLLAVCPVAQAGEVVVPFVSAEATIQTLADGTISLTASEMATFSSPGNPALPFTSKYVLLPPNADVDTLSIEIRNGVEEAIPGSFSVQPVPALVTYSEDKPVEVWDEGRNIVDGRDVDIYSKDAFYPSSNVILGTDSHLGPYLMVRVQYWPYKYNPVTGELVRLVSGDVAITFKTKKKFCGATPDKALAAFADRLNGFAVNSTQASKWYGRPRTGKSFNYLAPDNTLLILTTRDIWNSCWPTIMQFVYHKQALGWTLGLADDYTWAGGPSPGGNAAAELLRTYLQSQYTSFRYLLLIGDPTPTTGLLPMKLVSHNGPGVQLRGTDYYYADLTGNWDLNGDGIAGEGAAYPAGDFGTGGVDMVNEMMVGRIPYTGGAMSQINTMLQKVITYEDATTVGSWAQRMLLPMVPLDGNTPAYQCGENIKDNVLLPSCREYYRIYNDTYGLTPAPEAGPNSDTATITAWLNGYGFMFEVSHGIWEYALAVINQVNCQYLPDAMPSHVMLASCQCADATVGNNVAHQLMRCGAISVVGATWDVYYFATSDYTNTDIPGGYAYRYAYNLARLKQRVGDAWWNTQAQVPFTQYPNHTRLTLFGDPTVKAQWPTEFEITTPGLLPDAKVGIYYRKDLFAAGFYPPYTWSYGSGSLPAGLYLDPSGYIYGTPTTAQTRLFTIYVQDIYTNGRMKRVSLTVNN